MGDSPGYKYSDDQIVGFSVNHLNGAGCPAQRDFPLTPMVGDVDPEATLPFSHSQEVASPGFWRSPSRIGCDRRFDRNAANRNGAFPFSQTSAAHLLLRSAMPWDLLVAKDASLQVVSSTLVTGWRSDAFCAMGSRPKSILRRDLIVHFPRVRLGRKMKPRPTQREFDPVLCCRFPASKTPSFK